MPHDVSDKDLCEFREAFSLFDKSGDEKIDSEQVGDLLRALGCNPTVAEASKIAKELDPEGTRRVSFEEFLPVLLSCKSKESSLGEQEFVNGLRTFDMDGTGTISIAELRHVLTSLGEKLTEAQVDASLQMLPESERSRGQVNYEEFVKAVMSAWAKTAGCIWKRTSTMDDSCYTEGWGRGEITSSLRFVTVLLVL